MASGRFAPEGAGREGTVAEPRDILSDPGTIAQRVPEVHEQYTSLFESPQPGEYDVCSMDDKKTAGEYNSYHQTPTSGARGVND